MGEFQRAQRLGIAGRDGRVDFLGADAEAGSREIDPIEPQRIFGERGVAARAHVGDDRGDRRVHVDGRFAFGFKERAKSRVRNPPRPCRG